MVTDLGFWHPFEWIRLLNQLRTLLNCENLSAANQVDGIIITASITIHGEAGERSFDLMLMLTQPGFKKADLLSVDSASPFTAFLKKKKKNELIATKRLRDGFERGFEIYWISVFERMCWEEDRVWERIYWDLRKRRGWVCSCCDLRRKKGGPFKIWEEENGLGWYSATVRHTCLNEGQVRVRVSPLSSNSANFYNPAPILRVILYSIKKGIGHTHTHTHTHKD